MPELILSNMSIVWAAVMLVFLIIEGATAGLTCIWFAIGALAGLIAALFGAPLWLQIVWFFVISVVTLYFTRPLVKKYVIGKEALVTEAIDNVEGAGAVAVGGKVWTARSDNGSPVEVGKIVTVLRIEGVKLIVSPEEKA